jgi:DNA repair exonuclease SbcCD ATPase subunit
MKMNVKELIEHLQTMPSDTMVVVTGDRLSDQLEQAATMLRQQQERIKQLEETQEYLYKTHDTDKAQIEALKRPNNVVGVPADKLAEMQTEIEALKAKLKLHEAMDNQCASLMQQFRKASEK